MEIQIHYDPENEGRDEYVIAPLSRYVCDGVAIELAGFAANDKPLYLVGVYESKNGVPWVDGKPEGTESRNDSEVADSTYVYMQEEELDAFFMCYQALKLGKTVK